ncbi:LPS export ABC transporter periplasmic protein LptC [Prevotella aurantiaca]|uniref:LPS export ABC transporter periplasmic protein LptC n=1 Tax=Prevotella aurantiaca TaxID=596085 RepID=UPI0023F1C603
MKQSKLFISCMIIALCVIPLLTSCSEKRTNEAPAIYERDSVPIMTTYGVNTLISDSRVIKYRITAEEWEVNEVKNPSRWTFNKGLLLTQFDLKKHVLGFIQCDTAIYYDKERRWELHGHVQIVTEKKVEFYSRELFWDERNHQIWSRKFSRIKTPDKVLEGDWFKSDEQMTVYEIRRTKGWGIFKERELSPNSDGAMSMPSAPIDAAAQKNIQETVIN